MNEIKHKLIGASQAFLAWFSYYRKRDIVLNRPRINNIEVTNKCNIQCIICPQREQTRQIGNMDLLSFKEVVAECDKYTDKIGICGFGEPLLNPDIVKMIEHCTQKGLRSRITSNGTLLTRKKAEALVDAGLGEIVIALDGVGETYNRIRKGAKFDLVCANIEGLREIIVKKKNPVTKLMISIVEMEDTKEQIAELRNKWEFLTDEVMVRPVNDRDGTVESLTRVANMDQGIKREYPCTFLWWEVAILWNGDVVPCCVDWDGKYVLGNIKDAPLREIWNNPKARALRKQHIKGNFKAVPLCVNCSLGADSEVAGIAVNPFSKDLLKVVGTTLRDFVWR